jgi:hypothetical protein
VIRYTAGYKYQLAESYELFVDVRPEYLISDDYVSLDTDGRMILHKGYATDGPSGPTIDTNNFIRGAFVHDAGYQLIRNGHLSIDTRDYWDCLLYSICRDDGMSAVRAWYVYKCVSAFGWMTVREPRPVLTSP